MSTIVYGSYLIYYSSDRDRFDKCNKIDKGDVQGFRFIPDYVKSLEDQLKASQDECEELKKMQDHLKWKDETRKQLKASREECDQLKAEVKKKKNRIGILNRSLRRLKKE